jgi:amino acid adenylation domain-containing protein/non-ribosomal peptide synthase protein (TIGR01720 family)
MNRNLDYLAAAAEQNPAGKEYWLNKIAGELSKSYFPYDTYKKGVSKHSVAEVEFALPKGLNLKLRTLSSGSDDALHMILLTGLVLMLHKYTGNRDIIVGMPIYKEGEDEGPGQRDFINTALPIRSEVIESLTFKELLLQVRENVIEADKNSNYPIEILSQQLNMPFNEEESCPLFDIALLLDNIQDKQHVDYLNLDIIFVFSRTAGSIAGFLEFNSALYEKDTIERIIKYYTYLLHEALANVDMKLPDIDILSADDRKQLLFDFNSTGANYPKDKTIRQLFEEQVERLPDNVAVVQGNTLLTYAELNLRANRTAYTLRSKGMAPGAPAAIMTGRSIEMISGILGVLKAGGNYLPINPDAPVERIKYMLRDCRCSAALSDNKSISKIKSEIKFAGVIINIEAKTFYLSKPDDLSERDSKVRRNNNIAVDPAYIIYTSGTTGKPKGVIIEHKNVVRLMVNDKFFFDFDNRDVWTMFHSYNFDFSVWEMYGALLYGGKLVVISKMEARDPLRYLQVLKKEQVTILNQTPSAFYNLVEEELKYRKRELNLRYVIFGGEALKPVKLKKWQERYPRTRLINMFGITETTVHVTYKEITAVEIASNISNIGKPIPTLSAYIMDANLNVLPVGAAGELCVAGDGVGRGYLNRPELTLEKFVDNPYKPGERLYRSGDLGKLLKNGDMEYSGRIDHQVKIRGFRIELAEIEYMLLKHKMIKEAIVLLKESETGMKDLYAYVVRDNNKGREEELGSPGLREYLAKVLPGYMVPAYFILLNRLPLTPNGKIDRKALIESSGFGLGSGVEYTAPRNDIEKKLVEVWQQVLGRDKIGIDDDFFAVGGDSIKTIQIVSRMTKVGYRIDMKDIFRRPRISELSQCVRKIEQAADQSPVSGTIPLTPIQRWFFESKLEDKHHFNQSVMLYSQEGFDEQGIKQVFLKLLEHHDALRMTFEEKNGTIVQVNHGLDYPLFFQVFDYRNRKDAVNELENKANRIQASFDLKKGPLLKVGLFYLDDGERLLIAVHHLAIDGVSWRILFEDIENLYRQYKNGQPFNLPLKTGSFKLWSEKLLLYANSESLLKEKNYWLDLEAKRAPGLKKDSENGNDIEDPAVLSFSLSEEETNLLLTRVNQAFATDINDILLTAFGIAVKAVFENDRLAVFMEGHGREEIIEDIDISRTIGWFTSLFPVLLDISYENDTARQIKAIKETLHRVPNRGIGFGILKYLTAGHLKDSAGFQLKPQVIFNYLGQFAADLERMSFAIAAEPAGALKGTKGRREYDLEVTGIITGKQLVMTINYNKAQYKSRRIRSLWDRYLLELQRIISYCSVQKGGSLTPCDLTYKDLSIEAIELLEKQYPNAIDDIYPCTPMQEGMLFHALLDSATSAHFVQISYRVQGEVDVALIKESLDILVKRHHILRTAFIYEGLDRPLQLVLKERNVEFIYKDLLDMISTTREKDLFIKRFEEKDRQRKFDLSKDPLLRAAVIRVNDNDYRFIWSFHHVLMDGWCGGIVNSEFFENYIRLRENNRTPLPGVTPYRTYIRWLESREKEAARKYWRELLEGYGEAVVIPGKKNNGQDSSRYEREEFFLELGAEKTEGLNKLAAASRVTISCIIQAVWGIILGKYNNKQDIVFGIVVSGRPDEIAGVEAMVGLFINTIPVRIRFRESTPFTGLLHSVQNQAIKSEAYHYYPLAEIQAESLLKQHLMDHFLTFLNYPVIEQIEEAVNKGNKKNPELKISDVKSVERSNYDLDVLIYFKQELKIKFRFNTACFDSDFMKRMAVHVEEVIDQIINNNEIKISDIVISHNRLIASPNIPMDDNKNFEL